MISPTFNSEHGRGAMGQPAPPLITTSSFKNKSWVSFISSLITRDVLITTDGALDSTMHLIDVNLLDHTGLEPGCGFQSMAISLGQRSIDDRKPALMTGEGNGIAYVRVSRLATDLALNLTIGKRRFRRLDDVRGRRLGRGRGILPRRRELLLVFGNRRPRAQRAAPSIPDNLDKTSVPWISCLAMLKHRPQIHHNCSVRRPPSGLTTRESVMCSFRWSSNGWLLRLASCYSRRSLLNLTSAGPRTRIRT